MGVLRRHGCLLIALFAPACDPPEGERTHVYDEGVLCVNVGPHRDLPGEVAPTQLAVGAPLTFAVSLAMCLSASCDTEREAQCRATLEGDTLILHSVLRWKESGGSCDADCGSLSAECGTPPLAAGEYKLRFGDKERIITVPGLLSEPCMK